MPNPACSLVSFGQHKCGKIIMKHYTTAWCLNTIQNSQQICGVATNIVQHTSSHFIVFKEPWSGSAHPKVSYYKPYIHALQFLLDLSPKCRLKSMPLLHLHLKNNLEARHVLWNNQKLISLEWGNMQNKITISCGWISNNSQNNDDLNFFI